MKAFAASSLVFLFLAGSAHADIGVGIQGSLWLSETPFWGPSLLFSPRRNIHIGVDYGADMTMRYQSRVGVYGDYWVFTPQIGDFGPEQGRVFLFSGAGLFFNYSKTVNVGLRFPIGLDYRIKRMDFVLQTAPSLALYSGKESAWFALHCSLGGRWWF